MIEMIALIARKYLLFLTFAAFVIENKIEIDEKLKVYGTYRRRRD